MGKPKFIKGSWIKEKSVIIDCGITPMQSIDHFHSISDSDS